MLIHLVEAHTDVAALVEPVLVERGHTVVAHTDASAARQVLEDGGPDLLVLTAMNAAALDVAEHARDRAGGLPMIIGIVETCTADRLEAAFEAGVDDCFSPPHSTERLRAQFAFVEKRLRGRRRRVQAVAALRARVAQQAAVAELGRHALASPSLGALMTHATEAIAAALDTELCTIVEHVPEDDRCVPRAGLPDDAPDALMAGIAAQAARTLEEGAPLTAEALDNEAEGEARRLAEAGVRSGVSVVITGDPVPYGVLSAYATEERPFNANDVHFLAAASNVLASAIERTRTEQALRESEAHVRAILETTVDGIITIDARGRILSFNAAAEAIFGYDEGEVLGENVKMLMPSPYHEEHDGYIQSYHDTGRRQIIGIGREVTGLRASGDTFPMDLAVSEVEMGERTLFSGIVRDITERRRLEKEIMNVTEQERRRIGQDLHDGLGQMLTGIGLLMQNLTRRLESEGVPGAEEAAEITNLVKDADQYARDLAHGLTPVDLDASGLSNALKRLVNNAERLFEVECAYDEVGDAQVHNGTAATHMYRIAQEAVSNAVRHGSAQRIKIRLAAEPEQVRLRVHDDGSGFNPNAHESDGMGLHIMNHRARIIGGRLEISSVPDGGTTVTCTLPRTASPATSNDAASTD